VRARMGGGIAASARGWRASTSNSPKPGGLQAAEAARRPEIAAGVLSLHTFRGRALVRSVGPLMRVGGGRGGLDVHAPEVTGKSIAVKLAEILPAQLASDDEAILLSAPAHIHRSASQHTVSTRSLERGGGGGGSTCTHLKL
jgi:hypothetical protein